MRFSANLGFLWTDLPLPHAIIAAKSAGFDAVECHFPYDTPVQSVVKALADTGFAMVGLNTRRGEGGANGLAAVPGREVEAMAHIDEAIAYASAIGAANIHVMAGRAEGAMAEKTFVQNLRYACAKTAPDQTILIEPLNTFDAPEYFLSKTAQAQHIIEAVAATNLKLMFDCYHLQIMEGDVCRLFTRLLPLIGHVQIAAVPNRGPPDYGELDYGYVLQHIAASGYQGLVAAEYRPVGKTEDTLGWLPRFKELLSKPSSTSQALSR